MKVGSLVKKKNSAKFQDQIGIVVELQPSLSEFVRICWSQDYGTFWHAKTGLKVISEVSLSNK